MQCTGTFFASRRESFCMSREHQTSKMFMKKIIVLAFTSMLSLNLLSAEQAVNDADQKWLTTVTKMVVNGRHEISTPVEVRTQLLKDWAKKNGYSVQVTKVESTFRVELAKEVAKN
jgi:hypothetical protein